MSNKFLGPLIEKMLNQIHLSDSFPTYLSVAVENAIAILRGKLVRFGTDKDGGLFAKERNWKLQISDRRRGFWLYRNGIDVRGVSIFKSYCLQNIEFKKDDIVFDCGANSGDLFLKLSRLISGYNYFAFEPNPADFNVLKSNVHNSKNLFNLALGNVDSELTFYIATSGGDSSLVEPKTYDEKLTVKVVRLDSFMVERKINSIKLLKIEAEGFEPEILEGLGAMVRCCEYLAVDGGYERGKDCEQTFTTCTNYLLANGFEIVDICFPWHRALYKRK
jgi:FkbM family methyltransferase